jgi:curli biogenesis system outer membrane secretion channel CsgG
MQRRNALTAVVLGIAAFTLGTALKAHAQDIPKIAVTDLAYTQAVAEYFEVGTFQTSAQYHASLYRASGSVQSSGTYVEGVYNYMEQRELGSFTNDIKGSLLKGTNFRLIQGKTFDAGMSQHSKAEQVLHQVKTGKLAAPVRQPEVKDIIARIRKGEFNGADFVLFGTLSTIQFRDSLSPLQGTTSATRQFSLDLLADFSLINTKTYEIKAAFSAQGAGNDSKILSNRGDIAPPNRAKVMRETSQSLGMNVFEQIADQLNAGDPSMARGVRQPGMPPPPMQGQQPIQQQPQAVILR